MPKKSFWGEIKHFSKNENWGNPLKISPRLVYKLDAVRNFIGCPFIISEGTQGKHAKNSAHYRGEAVDIVILHKGRFSVLDILISLERYDWGGLGYYPDWSHKNKITGGWHLDVRLRAKHTHGARWMGVLDDKGERKYVGLTHYNLLKYGALDTNFSQ